MTSSRIIRIPIEHVKAELATFPLASEKALELAVVDLCPQLKNSTAPLWRKAEQKVIGHLPGFSIDEAISIRDFLWFSGQPKKKVPLHCYLKHLAGEFLETQGAVAIPNLPSCLFPNGTDSRAHKPLARQTWWWLSVSLPADILLAALHSNKSQPERIEVVSPLLDRQLSDFGFAETHLHMGVGMDFRTLWVAALVAIADLDFKHDAFESTGAGLNEGKLLAPWLIRGAIMRYILAGYLCCCQQYDSLELYIANVVRSKLAKANDFSSYSVLMQVLSELQQGKLFQTNNQERSYVSLQMLYKILASPQQGCQFDIKNGFNTVDPIAHLFPMTKSGKISPDLYFISQSINYLESKYQQTTDDKLFEKVFWQLIRIQSQLHRHSVQRPLTPGLQWFLRFYSHSSPIRKVFNTRANVISSAITSGLGRGLKSLELRTSPFTSNSELLTFIIDVRQAAEEIQKNNKNEQALELGIVFPFY